MRILPRQTTLPAFPAAPSWAYVNAQYRIVHDETTVLIRLAPNSETATYCQAESGAASLFAGSHMAAPQAFPAKSAIQWGDPHVVGVNRISTETT